MSALGNASNAAGLIRFGMNPTPMGAAGLAFGLLGGGLFGGGAPGIHPGYVNGRYTNNDQILDTSKFNFAGDKGNYDLIPALRIKPTPTPEIQRQGILNTQQPSVAQSLYEQMRGVLGNDTQALSQFENRFPMGKGESQYLKPFGWTPSGYRDALGLVGKVLPRDLVGRVPATVGSWASQLGMPTFR